MKAKEDIPYVYNKKENVLIFLSFDHERGALYKIKGWFGKKLYELLKNKRENHQMWDDVIFTSQPELKEAFQRLILTLIQENILESASKEFFSLQPLSSKERKHFGLGDLTGTLIVEKLPANQELQAYAGTCHEGNYYYKTGSHFCSSAPDNIFFHGVLHCDVRGSCS